MDKMPGQDESTASLFKEILPPDPGIKIRPMFGNLAAFVNGNMFAGVFGDQIFVRLPDEVRARLIEDTGAKAFQPMDGRPMREYISLPVSIRADQLQAAQLLQQSFSWAASLPAKVPKPKKPPRFR